jgi:hypothetical protein
MSKYNEELVNGFVERELGKFINENQDVIECTVGETILIMQATTAYCEDLLQGLSEKWQRSLVVDSTLEHTKKLMLGKRGIQYGEDESNKKAHQPNGRTRRTR